MVDDLLYISKTLLALTDSSELAEGEKDYIINFVRKMVFVLLIELNKAQ